MNPATLTESSPSRTRITAPRLTLANRCGYDPATLGAGWLPTRRGLADPAGHRGRRATFQPLPLEVQFLTELTEPGRAAHQLIHTAFAPLPLLHRLTHARVLSRFGSAGQRWNGRFPHRGKVNTTGAQHWPAEDSRELGHRSRRLAAAEQFPRSEERRGGGAVRA